MEQTRKLLGYDDLYHLYMNIKLSSGTSIRLEKNEVVQASGISKFPGVSNDTILIDHNVVTLKTAFDNMEKKYGKDRTWLYSIDKFNCQRFVCDFLEANDMLTKTAENWILQDAAKLLQNNSLVISAMTKVTDLAGLWDVAIQGAGVESWDKMQKEMEESRAFAKTYKPSTGNFVTKFIGETFMKLLEPLVKGMMKPKKK